MDISDALLVFILIYFVVMGVLYLLMRYWSVLKSGASGASSSTSGPPPIPGDALSASGGIPSAFSARPAAPRPPRLRPPPVIDPTDAVAYARRLDLCARVVGFIASSNPTGFPVGLFREWYQARRDMANLGESPDSGPGFAEALRDVPPDDASYRDVLGEIAKTASYAEMADLVHFCGEAFAAARSGSPVHAAILDLADRLAVVVGTGGESLIDEEDRRQLERKLEVDFIGESKDKVAHLRRMHAFFRERLLSLRDDVSAERRTERMADCRRHMEEHERLLGWLGAQA